MTRAFRLPALLASAGAIPRRRFLGRLVRGVGGAVLVGTGIPDSAPTTAGAASNPGTVQSGQIVVAPALSASGLPGATGASRYAGATAAGPPSTGTFEGGDFVIDLSGTIWICRAAGSPGSWVQVSASGVTVLTRHTVTDPAPAGEVMVTAPAGQTWQVYMMQFTLATSPAPAHRNFDLVLDDGRDEIGRWVTSVGNQSASTKWRYQFGVQSTNQTETTGTLGVNWGSTIPQLEPGHRLRTSSHDITGKSYLQPGDQFSNVILYVAIY